MYYCHLYLLTFLLCCGTTQADICTSAECKYDLVVRHAKAMTYRQAGTNGGSPTTFDVKLNGSTLTTSVNSTLSNAAHIVVSPDDVITVDGLPRTIITVNDMFPGPKLEFIQGAQVVIRVTNNLYLQSLTIHWHGITQQGTPYSDGAAYVTQCPIPPSQVFTYRFKAVQAGTFFYHSHFENQRNDGLQGMIIVHQTVPPPLPYFPIMIQEWNHMDAITTLTEDPHWFYYPGPGDGFTLNPGYLTADGNQLVMKQFNAGLINGRGRYQGNEAPLTTFTVTSGQKYRFHLTNAGFNFIFKVEIDEHPLEVVAVDGNEVVPVPVDAFMVLPGERVDFTITANQTSSSYWMRVSTVVANVVLPQTLAIVRYAVAPQQQGEPNSTQINCTAKQGSCVVFNCIFANYSVADNTVCVSLDSASSLLEDNPLYIDEYGLQEEPSSEIFLNFVAADGPAINGILFIPPRAPLLGFVLHKNPYLTPCSEVNCSANAPCSCTQMIDLEYNKVYQFVLTSSVLEPHPIHFHGHSFAVLKIGYQNINATTGLGSGTNPDFTCVNSACLNTKWSGSLPSLNVRNPPIKDTVLLPVKGYAVVRFRARNPGLWYVHCHLDEHFMHGMALLLNEAYPLQPLLPFGFPTCGDFD